jgi:deazaflavin-dependent oxidoreductase (nitroreductase family)
MNGVFPRILRIHQWIYEHTDGLLGHRLLFGNPTLLLRTAGRRTGLPRTTAVTYARDGDDYLIVACNGGRPKPPTWLANLKAHPDSESRSAAGGTASSPAPPCPTTPTMRAAGPSWIPTTKTGVGRIHYRTRVLILAQDLNGAPKGPTRKKPRT